MSYQLHVLDSDVRACSECPRHAEWRAVGHGPESAEILVAVPAATYDDEALGQVLHPASHQYSWLDFLFRHAGYPFKALRKTCAVRCAGDERPSRESVLACRQWLAAEVKATGARALVLVGHNEGWGPLLRGDANELAYYESGATFTLDDDASIPVFFVRIIEEAVVIQSPFLPPEDFLRDLKAVAEAVAAARDKSAATIDPERAFRAFLKQFIGYMEPRAVLPNAGKTVYQDKITKRLGAVGLTGDMQADALKGMRDIFLSGSAGFREYKFWAHKRNGKPSLFKGDWLKIDAKGPNDNWIAMHLTGEQTIGSMNVVAQAVLSFDIDCHNDLQRASINETLKEMRELFPKAFPVRSSHSGGVHLHLFLDKSVPYEELVLLARLFLQRRRLGRVRVGNFKYERVEIPSRGLRLPFGLGSFPLLPGFGEDSPVPEMLTELFRYAAENMVCAADLFLDERLEVKERLRKERRSSNIKTPNAMAAQLLRDEYDKDETRITDAELKRSLNDDPYGAHFIHAPEYIKNLYVRGIGCYGTRGKVTPAIPIWFAIVGRSEAKAVEVLTYWVNNRPHVSRNIKDHVDEVIEDLPMLVSKAFKYAREEGLAAGPFTTGDVRKLLDLLSKPLPDGPAPSRGGKRGRPFMARNPVTGEYWPRSLPLTPQTTAPKRLGTSNMHFLELGFELVRFLRGKGGECYVSHDLLKQWVQHGYSTQLKKLLGHGAIIQTAAPSMNDNRAATFKLLWPDHPGEPVTDLYDGLAAVMTEQEVLEVFKGRPGPIKDILKRMRSLRRSRSCKLRR